LLALTGFGKHDEIKAKHPHVKELSFMRLLTVGEAAAKIDTSRETIEEWIRLGLLIVHFGPQLSQPAEGQSSVEGRPAAKSQVEQWIDEDELFDVAEREGWLELGAENWDGDEEG
jgi:hypothetical protein